MDDFPQLQFIILVSVGFVNFIVGIFWGREYFKWYYKEQFTEKVESIEKESYFAGFRDAIYYAADEPDSELYRPEMAEWRYKEYVAIKKGPKRH